MKFVILFLFTAASVFSQENVLTYKKLNLNGIIRLDRIWEEADSLNIKFDRVYIKFIVNDNCKIESLEIEKEGKLKSHVKEINFQKQKLIKLFEEQLDCDWIKRQGLKKIQESYPITFRLE